MSYCNVLPPCSLARPQLYWLCSYEKAIGIRFSFPDGLICPGKHCFRIRKGFFYSKIQFVREVAVCIKANCLFHEALCDP